MNGIKITDEDMKTFNGFQWVLGEDYKIPLARRYPDTPLCSDAWFHYYKHLWHAYLFNGIHGCFDPATMRMFKCEVSGVYQYQGTEYKSGCTRLKLIEEIPVMRLTYADYLRVIGSMFNWISSSLSLELDKEIFKGFCARLLGKNPFMDGVYYDTIGKFPTPKYINRHSLIHKLLEVICSLTPSYRNSVQSKRLMVAHFHHDSTTQYISDLFLNLCGLRYGKSCVAKSFEETMKELHLWPNEYEELL